MSVVFIAIPTKGTVVDGRIAEHVNRDIAKIHDMFPTVALICPMMQDYQLLPYMQDQSADYQRWGAICEKLLKRCDEMVVLMYEGWSKPFRYRDGVHCTSVGVEGEIAFAINNNIAITFVNPATMKSVWHIAPQYINALPWQAEDGDYV